MALFHSQTRRHMIKFNLTYPLEDDIILRTYATTFANTMLKYVQYFAYILFYALAFHLWNKKRYVTVLIFS